MMKPALLIIDVLQEFFEHGRLAKHRRRLVKNINALVDAAHAAKVPVIWIRQEYKPDLSDAPIFNREQRLAVTIKGTDGCKLLPELHFRKGDCEIIKKRYSAFFKTRLEALLKKFRADSVIIAGVNTMTCVRMAAIDAYQRDFHVILALDAVDAYDVRQHRDSLAYLQHAIATGLHHAPLIRQLSLCGRRESKSGLRSICHRQLDRRSSRQATGLASTRSIPSRSNLASFCLD